MKTLLKARNVSKVFSSEGKTLQALYPINLDVHEGEIFGIIGPSGAGKSTLLRCLSTLEKPSEGEIFFESTEITGLQGPELRQIRREFGMVFQNFQLLSSRTVFGNIAFPLEIVSKDRDFIQTRVDELLEWVSLADKKNSYPSELSGGQKQRVGIARALATSPKLLFCDEATSALDSSATKQILDLLKRLQKQLNFTIVLITHEMEVIRQICHRVAVLSHGQIVECQPTVDLFTSPQHSITKKLLQMTHHQLPGISPPTSTRKMARLSFHGASAQEPIISTMARECHIDINILSGWLDAIQEEIVGTLIVEICGDENQLDKALRYLASKNVGIELLGN